MARQTLAHGNKGRLRAPVGHPRTRLLEKEWHAPRMKTLAIISLALAVPFPLAGASLIVCLALDRAVQACWRRPAV